MLLGVGDMDRARSELEYIIEENPNFTGACIRLRVVFHRLRDTERAVVEWRQSALDYPQDTRPRAYLASVGTIPDTGQS